MWWSEAPPLNRYCANVVSLRKCICIVHSCLTSDSSLFCVYFVQQFIVMQSQAIWNWIMWHSISYCSPFWTLWFCLFIQMAQDNLYIYSHYSQWLLSVKLYQSSALLCVLSSLQWTTAIKMKRFLCCHKCCCYWALKPAHFMMYQVIKCWKDKIQQWITLHIDTSSISIPHPDFPTLPRSQIWTLSYIYISGPWMWDRMNSSRVWWELYK